MLGNLAVTTAAGFGIECEEEEDNATRHRRQLRKKCCDCTVVAAREHPEIADRSQVDETSGAAFEGVSAARLSVNAAVQCCVKRW
jgi:hypothetical protein